MHKTCVSFVFRWRKRYIATQYKERTSPHQPEGQQHHSHNLVRNLSRYASTSHHYEPASTGWSLFWTFDIGDCHSWQRGALCRRRLFVSSRHRSNTTTLTRGHHSASDKQRGRIRNELVETPTLFWFPLSSSCIILWLFPMYVHDSSTIDLSAYWREYGIECSIMGRRSIYWIVKWWLVSIY